MNKTFRNIAAFSAAAILFVACKKSDDNNNTTPSTPSMTLGGITYNQYLGGDALGYNFFGHTSYVLQANGKTADGQKYLYAYAISLANLKPVAGSYNIGGTSNLYAANQLQLLMQDSSAAGEGLYSSDSVTTTYATVSVTNGKVSVMVPSMRLAGLFTPTVGNTYNDTLTFTGTMTVQ